MTLNRIIKTADSMSASTFIKWLDAQKINWTMLDADLMNYDNDYFNITLDDFQQENIMFYDGVFQE